MALFTGEIAEGFEGEITSCRANSPERVVCVCLVVPPCCVDLFSGDKPLSGEGFELPLNEGMFCVSVGSIGLLTLRR